MAYTGTMQRTCPLLPTSRHADRLTLGRRRSRAAGKRRSCYKAISVAIAAIATARLAARDRTKTHLVIATINAGGDGRDGRWRGAGAAGAGGATACA
jgi:hypothetical protein